MKLDYLDIYYLHWPDRYTNTFGRIFYDPDPDPTFIKLEEQCEALIELIQEGVIKNIGLSNETPWGIMSFQNILKANGYKVNFLQNEYSLINRDFERSHSEISQRESIKLYSYSPLAFGLLTGKYFSNNINKVEYRLNKHYSRSKRYNSNKKFEFAKNYFDYCNKLNVNPITIAIMYGLTKHL